MLTYRTGAAGVASAARNMGEHLLQQTLPPEMAAMAEYYEEGAPPPNAADAAAGRYGYRATSGNLVGSALDQVLSEEIDRLSDSAIAGTVSDRNSVAFRAAGAIIAAKLATVEEIESSLVRQGFRLDHVAVERACAEAATTPDYSSAVAAPRRDLDPALADLLGIEPSRALSPGEIAFLLNGQRADGGEIAGKQRQSATEPLRATFGLARGRLPSRPELEHVLAGRKANGELLPAGQRDRAVQRFLAALGVSADEISADMREHLLAARGADGRALTIRQYQNRLSSSKSRIGYVDLTFSAPKSVSIAWAFAPTDAERAIIRQAHRDAIDSTMSEVERLIGRARKGKAGRAGWEPGKIAWVSFDHYAARPTVEVVRTTADGESYTELYTLKAGGSRVAGDMQLHTHNTVFNVVRTESGRVGGLDLAQLEGRVKEWGALYQAFLASNLRRHGVRVALDARTEMARLPDIPEAVDRQFSKRTLGGTAAARAYASSQGLNWDSLTPERKIGLLKAGVQDPRGAKGDDVSDMGAWRRTAAEIGYTHQSVLRPEAARPMAVAKLRREAAYEAAMPLLTKQFERRAVIPGSDVRTAAAKGLIAGGIASPAEVSRLTLAFRQRGILQNGEPTKLIWGEIADSKGQEKVAVTTALHEYEEQQLIDRARFAGTDRTATLNSQQIEAAIRGLPELDFTTEQGAAQRQIIDHLGMSGRLAVAIGVAGSGKSTLLRPLVKAWQDDGRAVYGIALSWRQTDDLKDAGLFQQNRRAVEPFVRGLSSGQLVLGPRDVVVIDEVGLLGTRQLNEILAARAGQNFSLVAIGDPRQMQAVEAGPVLDLLERALGADNIPVLGSSMRQRDPEERETVLMFREGQAEEAVARKAANNTLRVVPGGYEDAVSSIVDLWQERRAANAERSDFKITLSAPTNFDAHAISLAIRQRRRELGELGDDRIVVPASDVGWPEPRTFDLRLAVGDRVRLFRHTNAAGKAGTLGFAIGRNGSVLDVRDIQDSGLVLRSASGHEGFVPWTTLRDRETKRILLDYGEVLTTNTAQGSTVSEHIHAMPGGTRLVSGFGAYTAGSRHREKSFIVVSDGAERAEIAGRRPLGDRREILFEDVLANIVRNFTRQPKKDSSLDLIARAKRLRRGAIQGLQACAQVHQKHGASGEGTYLPQRFAEARLRRALERQTADWQWRWKNQAEGATTFVQVVASLAKRVANMLRRQKQRYWPKAAEASANHEPRMEPHQDPKMKL